MIHNTFDNGFVTGVLELASEFDLDELDVATFLSEKGIDFNSVDEQYKTWFTEFSKNHAI